ncbi:DUF5987 family protein [Streptomyces sp900105245]|uniref:DUF5987 family protein n=1 Tax=Streptomyces sp. 900105245 TaxID=3154379 RepID=A0ABV1ULE2_9ACTN
MPSPDRRMVLKALATTFTVLCAGQVSVSSAASNEFEDAAGEWTVHTLEAFADTLIPGERRFKADLAIADAVAGPGAVQAGVITTLFSPELPLAAALPEISALLNARAILYAADHLILLPITVPAFVSLSFRHRTALVRLLFDLDDPDRAIWQMLSLLTGLAFDSAAHSDTHLAVASGHPGLSWLHFPPPGADGLWNFPAYSYGSVLASTHPATTASGSPT